MPTAGFRGRGQGVPGEELDYVEITAPVGPVATTEGTANVVATTGGCTCDGSPIIVSFYASSIRADPTAGRQMQLVLLMDGVVVDGQWALVKSAAAAVGQVPCYVQRRITPAPGAHTFTVAAFVNAGTGNIDAGAGGSGAISPAFVRVARA